MFKNTLQNSFKEFCRSEKFEINKEQIKIVQDLEKFLSSKTGFFDFFLKKKIKLCFYLNGNVGVGKTMIMNHVFEKINKTKVKFHFNKFMINFHNYRHENKEDSSILKFVKNLKNKYELIYLDEFQVTNIVDAMILGKLFETIFKENIKILITSNTKISDLYKDGLQREQFIPFINLIGKKSIQKELYINEDYRLLDSDSDKKIFYPLNEKSFFSINQNFRVLTKNFKRTKKTINTKGRILKIDNFYNGIVKFDFKELCDRNLGAEDYLNLSNICKHIFIYNIDHFNEYNSNQQLRFITLIDILYEKKISLTLSIISDLKNLKSSEKHAEPFKRTISRLHAMTT